MMTRLRWAWAEIDLSAVRENVATLKSRLAPGCKFMAVVKADGYGHGAVEVARAALAEGADFLGVATVQEARELRKAGIIAPLLILSEPPIEAIPLLFEHRVIPTVTTTEFILALGDLAEAREDVAPFHLKVDTGMNRIGVHHLDAPGFANSFSFHRSLRMEGVFTHFATADVPGDWEFTAQLERFKSTIAAMRHDGIDPGLVHAANSAATILSAAAHFDMVRVGISLYGLHPSDATKDKVDLVPALSVKARISFVKEPPLGAGVGYGLTHRTGPNSQIGTVPLGYADGLRRGLSNEIDVLHNGRRVQQVGRICMDQFMVETEPTRTQSGFKDGFEIGDEVVIVGRQGSEEISLDELAGIAGTINYELACGFGARLEKSYK